MKTTHWSLARFASIVCAVALAVLLGGVPVARAATETNSASVSVAIAAQADVAVHNDGVDTYVLTVTDRGGGVVEGLVVQLPIGPGYRLAAANFDRGDAWVSAVNDAQATIRIEGMRGEGDAVKATLRFVGPADSAVSALSERATASWSTEEEQFSALSNLPGAGVWPLTATTLGKGYNLRSDVFAPGEPVTFWYTSPAGISTRLVVVDGMLCLQPAKSDIEEIDFSTYKTADERGALALPLDVAGIAPGSYTLVAYGNWSGATAAASIQVR